MAYRNIIDQHVHTDNSFDGNHNVMFICEKALENNLRGVTFTDHCDVDYGNTSLRKLTVPAYVEVMHARKAFVGKLIVGEGIEIGQGIYKKELAEDIISALDYDFVLGAIHNLENEKDFYFYDYSICDDDKIKDLLTRYFDAEIELAKWNKFDSLAHLTYPLRYIVGEQNFKVDLNDYNEQIEAVFELLIKNEKALEINTSGLRQAIADFLPDKQLVEKFKKMGGKYITIGSDAHFAYDVGKGCEEGMKMAVESGFNQLTLFEHREPILINIE